LRLKLIDKLAAVGLCNMVSGYDQTAKPSLCYKIHPQHFDLAFYTRISHSRFCSQFSDEQVVDNADVTAHYKMSVLSCYWFIVYAHCVSKKHPRLFWL